MLSPIEALDVTSPLHLLSGPRAAVAGESHQGSRKDSQEERETEGIGKHTISS